MPNESGVIICPNPKCHRKIEEPIFLDNLSTTPAEQYHACPYCFIKLNVISTQPQKQEEEKKKKEKPPVKPPQKKEKGPSRCAGYIGYLATLPKNKPIPQECLICPKVLECIMKTSDSRAHTDVLVNDIHITNCWDGYLKPCTCNVGKA